MSAGARLAAIIGIDFCTVRLCKVLYPHKRNSLSGEQSFEGKPRLK